MKESRVLRRLSPVALLAVLVALSMSFVGPSSAAARSVAKGPSPVVAHNAAGTMTAPVTGKTGRGQRVRANFTPRRFVEQGDQLMAVGTLKGKIAKHGHKSFKRTVAFPVQSVNGQSVTPAAANRLAAPAAAGQCPVLNLVLGPLHLNLLGLVVDLNQVVLNVVAQSGAGQLLGNLLCAVAGLLDPGNGPLSGLLLQLGNLLNQILGQLGL